ncbi:MAG TPA: zf-HC2 domain-containing protein [Candidatus Acidoferrum sp.]|nr:zf-HC2 domain-containing protein [Candidatus Acidoferrum sp.]
MKCEEIGELLPDYLQEGLQGEKKNIVERHLANCAECSEVAGLWKKLALIPEEEPSAEGRARFEAMLQAYQTGRGDEGARRGSPDRTSLWSGWRWLRSPAGAVAWSVALVALGVFLGMQAGSTKTNLQDLAAMHTELTNMRQMVALSMLQQQSASQRLEGVTWTRREEQLDPQVLAALMRTLRYDPSVDVRLAALDALSRHAGQPQVKRTVVDALQEQQSPLVQVALIDQLVEWRDADAAAGIEKLRQEPHLNPTVRQRADWAISKLN